MKQLLPLPPMTFDLPSNGIKTTTIILSTPLPKMVQSHNLTKESWQIFELEVFDKHSFSTKMSDTITLITPKCSGLKINSLFSTLSFLV